MDEMATVLQGEGRIDESMVICRGIFMSDELMIDCDGAYCSSTSAKCCDGLAGLRRMCSIFGRSISSSRFFIGVAGVYGN